jgi:hypothetical protein
MGDKIIITDDEPKPAPQVVVVAPEADKKTEKVVTEKTTVTRVEENRPAS